jgi:hypothetical protein
MRSLRRETRGPVFNTERDQWDFRESTNSRIEDSDWEVAQPLGEKGVCTKEGNSLSLSSKIVFPVIHQVAQAGFPEEPPKDEQAVLIHAEFSDSAGPEKAPFSVFPLL